MNDITYVGRHSLIHTVSRHAHENWEFVYCTYGTGAFLFDDFSISYKKGDVVIIPPLVPHSNASEQGFQNIHVNMAAPTLTFKKPSIIVDDSNHFMLDAFTAAFYHFYSDRKEKTALLSAYGDLISCYLVAYQTVQQRSSVVDRIEHNIISNYADCKYLIDKRLQIAAEVLVNNNNNGSTIADIALMCGFRDPLYFSKMFKKKYGIAPSYYLKSKQTPLDAPVEDADSVKVMLEDV